MSPPQDESWDSRDKGPDTKLLTADPDEAAAEFD
jgi:hypothetical protein